MLWNKDDLGMSQRYDASAKAAQDIGVTVLPLGVREPDDFNEAFAAMDRDPPDAILMVTDSLTLLNRKRVFDYAAEHRLPAIYEQDFMTRDGGLMSYGADPKESFDRAAALTARIFQGAKPADLPFELPTRYLFVINMKTAKAMNLTVPNYAARARRRGDRVRRRDFIRFVGGAAASTSLSWPFAARAQQREQKRHVAVLMGGLSSGDADGQAEAAAFEDGLKELGWKLGGNIAARLSLAGRRARSGHRRGERDRRCTTRSCGQPLDAGHDRDGEQRTSRRLRAGGRSGRFGNRAKSGAARRQHHRVLHFRSFGWRQMA